MKIIIAIVFVLLFGSVSTATACAGDKDDIFFNVGPKFFAYTIVGEQQKHFVVEDTEYVLWRPTGVDKGKVWLMYKGSVIEGKLIPICRTDTSPNFVKWDYEALNPGGLGVQKEFTAFINAPKPEPTRVEFKNLTVIINPDAKEVMKQMGFGVYHSTDNIRLEMFGNGETIDMLGPKKSNILSLWTIELINGAASLVDLVVTGDGEIYRYAINIKTRKLTEQRFR